MELESRTECRLPRINATKVSCVKRVSYRWDMCSIMRVVASQLFNSLKGWHFPQHRQTMTLWQFRDHSLIPSLSVLWNKTLCIVKGRFIANTSKHRWRRHSQSIMTKRLVYCQFICSTADVPILYWITVQRLPKCYRNDLVTEWSSVQIPGRINLGGWSENSANYCGTAEQTSGVWMW